MEFLSEDDRDLADMDEERLRAWDLWFTLAQRGATNDRDPPYTHGVFVGIDPALLAPEPEDPQPGEPARPA